MLGNLLVSIFGESYRTTVMGAVAILYILASNAYREWDGDPETVANWLDAIAVIFVGAGLLPARDRKVSVAAHENDTP